MVLRTTGQILCRTSLVENRRMFFSRLDWATYFWTETRGEVLFHCLVFWVALSTRLIPAVTVDRSPRSCLSGFSPGEVAPSHLHAALCGGRSLCRAHLAEWGVMHRLLQEGVATRSFGTWDSGFASFPHSFIHSFMSLQTHGYLLHTLDFSLSIDIPRFIVLCLIAHHRCCIFVLQIEGKTQRITSCFIVILALLSWSATGPAVSQKSACTTLFCCSHCFSFGPWELFQLVKRQLNFFF